MNAATAPTRRIGRVTIPNQFRRAVDRGHWQRARVEALSSIMPHEVERRARDRLLAKSPVLLAHFGSINP